MKPYVLPAVFALAQAALAADWPQWRGPHRDGVLKSAPASWPQGLKKSWTLEVGEGHSSPVVSGDRVFIFARQNDEEVARCLQLDGSLVWKKSYAAPYKMHSAAYGHGKGPKSTPAVSDGRLVTFGIGGILSCFDAASGQLQWRHEFSKRFKAASPLYGAAASPLIEDGSVVVHIGGHDKGALAAFDLKTGKERWTASEDGPGYTSPMIARFDGVRQLVTQTQKHLVGVDPADGKLLWKLPFTTAYAQNSITPVVAAGLLINSGVDKGVTAYEIKREAGRWTPTVKWSKREVACYMSTPVLVGKSLYGLSHRRRGQLFCLDAATGEIHWTGPGRRASNAALIAAGDFVLAQLTSSRLIVLKASTKKLEPVADYKTGDSPIWSHPAVAGEMLLTKDRTTLFCWTR